MVAPSVPDGFDGVDGVGWGVGVEGVEGVRGGRTSSFRESQPRIASGQAGALV